MILVSQGEFRPKRLDRLGMYREFEFFFFLDVSENRKQVPRLRVTFFAEHPH